MTKNELRKFYLNIRKNLSVKEKNTLDTSIYKQIIEDDDFKNADTVLTYVSTSLEVNTIEVIKTALSLNKKVAIPKCTPNSNNMIFHYISSLEDLKKGVFNILEPTSNNPVTNFNNSICIVPVLAFDSNNHRLGYGKGFYDRFLSNYSNITIGLCYNNCIYEKLPTNNFDIPVAKIITDI